MSFLTFPFPSYSRYAAVRVVRAAAEGSSTCLLHNCTISMGGFWVSLSFVPRRVESSSFPAKVGELVHLFPHHLWHSLSLSLQCIIKFVAVAGAATAGQLLPALCPPLVTPLVEMIGLTSAGRQKPQPAPTGIRAKKECTGKNAQVGFISLLLLPKN